MKFSIILPIYKVEKYLRECIESILCQTYNDYEIILVDDGSPDSCPQICDEYATKKNNIQCIHRPNGGLSAARNSGLSIAKGEYVMFVDSDDLLADEHVLEKIAHASKSAPDIIHYKFQEWFESDGHTAPCRFSYNVPTQGRSLSDIYCDLIDRDAYYNSAWSKTIRRKLLVENQLYFKPGLLGEDNEWYYHVVMKAEKLVLIDEPLYTYRRRQGSITTTTTRKNLTDQLYVLDEWESLLQNKTDDGRSKIVWGSLAKQYCSALIIYASLQKVDDLWPRIHEKAYMLQYSKNKRVVAFRIAKKLLGLKGLIWGLKAYQKLR